MRNSAEAIFINLVSLVLWIFIGNFVIAGVNAAVVILCLLSHVSYSPKPKPVKDSRKAMGLEMSNAELHEFVQETRRIELEAHDPEWMKMFGSQCFCDNCVNPDKTLEPSNITPIVVTRPIPKPPKGRGGYITPPPVVKSKYKKYTRHYCRLIFSPRGGKEARCPRCKTRRFVSIYIPPRRVNWTANRGAR